MSAVSIEDVYTSQYLVSLCDCDVDSVFFFGEILNCVFQSTEKVHTEVRYIHKNYVINTPLDFILFSFFQCSATTLLLTNHSHSTHDFKHTPIVDICDSPICITRISEEIWLIPNERKHIVHGFFKISSKNIF